ncbi:unnamed protein product, partial [Phaeothamnion confervicola]
IDKKSTWERRSGGAKSRQQWAAREGRCRPKIPAFASRSIGRNSLAAAPRRSQLLRPVCRPGDPFLMGCLQSAPVASTDAQTNEVDKELHDAALREQNHFKILLLGTGESGKSTVVKQVKLIYNKGGLTDKEKAEAAQAIRRNCIECMQTLSEAMAALAIPLGDEGLADLATDVESLWRDSGVQTCYERRSEYWLLDASSYYFENAQRLAEEDFSPTDEDVIMTRVRTTGIAVTEFNDGPYHYSLVDVGGQRSERRKWIHCFDDVKAVIFLEGLSGYHQVLFEDATQNRMHESLELFEQVVSNPIFEKIPVFVFLNKKVRF